MTLPRRPVIVNTANRRYLLGDWPRWIRLMAWVGELVRRLV